MSDNLEPQEERTPTTETVESQPTAAARREARDAGAVRREAKDDGAPAYPKSTIREYFESAVVTLVMAVFGMTFILQAVKVPTGSMKNTIWIQDHLLVNKFIFGSRSLFPGRSVRRGDIVVFKYPGDPNINYVKRVIGLPGETIEFDEQTHKVYIDGQELPEHRYQVKPQHDSTDPSELEVVGEENANTDAAWPVYYYQDDEETFFRGESYAVNQPYKIPVKGDPLPDNIANVPHLQRIYDADQDGKYDSNQYFCMGDNRDNSEDGRRWGTVPSASIVGRAMLVYWSLDKTKEAEAGGSNPLMNFFKNSRWSRTGTFIK